MAQEKKSKVSILTNGIIKENPVLRLVLGTCSTLAVTTAVSSALGMGAAFTFVLASMALPPVASMGSRTKTSRSAISLGSLQ